MAVIYAWMLRHEPGCAGTVNGSECSEGCEWELIEVRAEFHPPAEMSLRERVQLARMAAMFEARRIVNGSR